MTGSLTVPIMRNYHTQLNIPVNIISTSNAILVHIEISNFVPFRTSTERISLLAFNILVVTLLIPYAHSMY